VLRSDFIYQRAELFLSSSIDVFTFSYLPANYLLHCSLYLFGIDYPTGS